MPKIYISRQQHYACIMCGRCCRRFHVLLRRDEIPRLAGLDWGDEKDVPQDFVSEINGYPYFSRKKSDGGCVFLDDEGVCRMHRRFGFAQKALTCRGYPFNIVSTFPGEVSVLARMDCPAVVRENGPLISAQSKDIGRLVSELRFGSGFTAGQLQGMGKDAVYALCRHLSAIVDDAQLPMPQCALLLMATIQRVAQLGGTFLNDLDVMREVYPSMKAKLLENIPNLPRYDFGRIARCLFRQLLTAYCRRDEEILEPTLGRRILQMLDIGRICLGFGNLKKLGGEHPDFPIRKVRLFDYGKIGGDNAAWSSYRRFLSVRLECLQFFGVAYYGCNIFEGLRALLLTYPLVLAVAKIHAASRSSKDILTHDVEAGVMAIDHCHGRSPAIRGKSFRSREKMLADVFPSILASLGVGLE